MSEKYVPRIRHETEFRGEKVVAEMEPMTRAQYLYSRAELSKSLAGTAQEQSVATYRVGCEVLKDSLLKIEGPTDASNLQVTKEVILDKVFFLPLVTELYSVLVVEAQVGKAKSPDSEVRSQG